MGFSPTWRSETNLHTWNILSAASYYKKQGSNPTRVQGTVKFTASAWHRPHAIVMRPSLRFHDFHGGRAARQTVSFTTRVPFRTPMCHITRQRPTEAPSPKRLPSSEQWVSVVLSCRDWLINFPPREKNHWYSRSDVTCWIMSCAAGGVNSLKKLRKLYENQSPASKRCWHQDKLQSRIANCFFLFF